MALLLAFVPFMGRWYARRIQHEKFGKEDECSGCAGEVSAIDALRWGIGEVFELSRGRVFGVDEISDDDDRSGVVDGSYLGHLEGSSQLSPPRD